MIRRHLVIIISLLPIVILSAVSFHALYNAHSLGITYFYDEGINQYRVSSTFIAVAFIISVYIPVRNRVRNIVKRLLKREVYDINEMSLKMSSYFIAETEIPVVIKKAMELITRCLHPRGGGIVMYWERISLSSPLPLWERIEVRGSIVISPKKKLNMVRLMQEALGNIIKHADATEVDINIKEKDGRITMEIKDNGKGFDSAIIQSKGYGLRNMKNRCDEMGAEFKIHSEIGKGTEIVVEMGA